MLLPCQGGDRVVGRSVLPASPLASLAGAERECVSRDGMPGSGRR
ncbi:hypothetical protein ACFFX0_30895 [Citricoccus parietis]|uniref:Uncharacterized protein n=1 Tax=Citricoccus parietis TaxID=592307 RepID=A0ABV5G8P7_9MICC